MRALRRKLARLAANEAAKAAALWDMKRQRLESLHVQIADIDRALTKHVLHVSWQDALPAEGTSLEQATSNGDLVQHAKQTVQQLVGSMSPLQLKVYDTMRGVVRQVLEVWTARRELEAQVQLLFKNVCVCLYNYANNTNYRRQNAWRRSDCIQGRAADVLLLVQRSAAAATESGAAGFIFCVYHGVTEQMHRLLTFSLLLRYEWKAAKDHSTDDTLLFR